MLSIGKVYLHNNETHYYVADKKRVKRRIVYKLRKVMPGGYLGNTYFKMDKKGEFELCSNIRISISVHIPKIDREKIQYEELINRTQLLLKEYMVLDDNSKSNALRNNIALNAWSACSFIKKMKNGSRHYNLRDVARSLKLKTAAHQKLYKWIVEYFSDHNTEDKYKYAIKKAADSTIIRAVNNYQRLWKSYYGFNSKLNTLLEIDLKEYNKELQKRGISL